MVQNVTSNTTIPECIAPTKVSPPSMLSPPPPRLNDKATHSNT